MAKPAKNILDMGERRDMDKQKGVRIGIKPDRA